MAGTIEEDDVMVIIIGDEEVAEENNKISCIPIKQEPANDLESASVDEILQTAVKHGEYVHIKQETEEYDDFEFLENQFGVEFLEETKYKVKDLDAEHEDEKPKDSATSMVLRSGHTGRKGMTPKEECKPKEKIVSFVEQLRKENPKFRKNRTLLVEHLAGIMRNCQPPPPPINFCKVLYEDTGTTYECTFCEVLSHTLGAASRHYQVKHGEHYLTCYSCGIKYHTTMNLYKHEKRCSGRDAGVVLQARGRYLGRKGRGRPFQYRNKFTPPHHAPRGPRTERFYCAQCPASFVHKQNLVAHENSHAGFRPYRCDACPAAYTSEVALKRHMQTHGEARFHCDHCGSSFKLKSLLISHIYTHPEFRKHGCLFCDLRFSQKSGLRRHVNRTHLKLPPDCECPICHKRYGRMSYVKDHMMKVHGLKMMTRKMFFQALPTMTDAALIQNAKVVFKTEPVEYSPGTQEVPIEYKDYKVIQQNMGDVEVEIQGNEYILPETTLPEEKVDKHLLRRSANLKMKPGMRTENDTVKVQEVGVEYYVLPDKKMPKNLLGERETNLKPKEQDEDDNARVKVVRNKYEYVLST